MISLVYILNLFSMFFLCGDFNHVTVGKTVGLTFCKRSDNVLMQDFPKLYFFQFSIIMLFMMGSLECLHNNLTLVVYCSLSSKKLLQQKVLEQD